MEILIVENAPVEVERWQGESASDRGVEKAAASVKAALTRKGFSVSTLKIGKDPQPLLDWLKAHNPQLVFNLCETICGNSKLEPAVPYLLKWLDFIITGNPPEILTLLVDKAKTKHLLKSMGFPTPEFAAIQENNDLRNWRSWPAILKPCAEDASLGIDRGSVVGDSTAAKARFELLATSFGVPVLIEAFIAGRELNVAILETESGLQTAINEIDFTDLPAGIPKIVTYNGKWDENSIECKATPVKSPANLYPELDVKIRDIAKGVYREFGLEGYARIDFRIDEEGKPWVLEINPNPDLSENAGFSKSLAEMHLDYDTAIECLIKSALRNADAKKTEKGGKPR